MGSTYTEPATWTYALSKRLQPGLTSVDLPGMAGPLRYAQQLKAALASIVVVAPAFWLITPATPAMAATPVASVAIGYDQSCAVASDGTGYCWGRNDYGQLGDGTTTDSNLPSVVAGSLAWRSIDGGHSFTCGVTTTNVGYCWGDNTVGQLGDGTQVSTGKITPNLIAGGHTWRYISAGYDDACGLTTTDEIYCWGRNDSGQVGVAGHGAVPTPTQIAGTWMDVSMGRQAACGVTTTNVGYCWGNNVRHGLGDGTTNNSDTPVLVTGSHSWSSIQQNNKTGCGLTTSNAMYCWGFNDYSQTGNDTGGLDVTTPTLVGGGHTFTSFAVGEGVTCATESDGTAWCWGAGALGAVGDGNNSNRDIPVAVAGSLKFTQLAAGGGGSCGVTTAQVTYCWGWNLYGTLGDGTNTNRNSPTGVLTLTNANNNTVTSVNIGSSFTFSVGGYNSGSCNGAALTATSSTATAVPLGHVTPSTKQLGAQTLSIATNAAGGYSIFIRSTGTMTTGSQNIADWTGTNGTPTAFPSAGTAAFGYSTDHALSGSATRFQTDKWAGLTTGNNEVAYAASSSGTTDTTHVCYQLGVASTTPAGNYTATVIYTAVPTY